MPALATVRRVADLRAQVHAWREAGDTVALVPTMGALHEGHLSLVRLARREARRVVVSLFVNPTQFGAGEDFSAYPRDEARDSALLAGEGCDLLFAPSAEEMYPPGFATTVAVSGLGEELEGAFRPGHFAGVATVVTKLLIQAGANAAVFGEKDYQQLQLIRRLARDLDLPTQIIPGPIVREGDGLALSSRNVYLDPDQRRIAPALHAVLVSAASALALGAAVSECEAQAREALRTAGFDAVDYVEARRPDDLHRLGPGPLSEPARLLAVARLGRTRLLDNLAVSAPRA